MRSQDSVHLIGSIAKNRAGRDISWQFFKENFQLLKGRWGLKFCVVFCVSSCVLNRYASGFLLSHLVKSCSERFLTEDAAVEVPQFFYSVFVLSSHLCHLSQDFPLRLRSSSQSTPCQAARETLPSLWKQSDFMQPGSQEMRLTSQTFSKTTRTVSLLSL